MNDPEMLRLLQQYPGSSTKDFPKPEFQLHPPWFLLPDADWIDIGLLFWNLEKEIEKHPERWGWDAYTVDGISYPAKKCYCGEQAIRWDQVNGYRCENHLGAGAPMSLNPPLIGYTGDMDRSGDYEHEW